MITQTCVFVINNFKHRTDRTVASGVNPERRKNMKNTFVKTVHTTVLKNAEVQA